MDSELNRGTDFAANLTNRLVNGKALRVFVVNLNDYVTRQDPRLFSWGVFNGRDYC